MGTFNSNLPEGVRASAPRQAGYAYVSLATNADFARGARCLMRSLRMSASTAQTKADLVVMHTGGVPQGALDDLRAEGVRLIAVDLLPTSDAFNAAHARKALHGAAPFTKGEKPGFHTPLDNFVKLRLWQLDYERVIFLDADTLVLQPIDKLFDYPEFCGAPNVYERLSDFGRLNSGVFTARPSQSSFAAMLSHLDRPGIFWRRTDQTFLQEWFPDWHGLPITYNMLQYVWLNLPQLWNWEAVKVIHYQYEKPWQDHAKYDALRPLIELWRAVDQGKELPALDTLPPPS